MSRAQPSHPSTHTRERLVLALNGVKPRQNIRVIQQRLPAARHTHGREIERENITPDGAVTRDRVKAPFTMPATMRANLECALQDMKNAGKFYPESVRRIVPEGSQRQTRLDKALEEHERDAVAQYLIDRDAEAATVRIGDYGGGRGGAAWDRLPITPHTQRALSRLAFVHRHLLHEERRDILDFARQCLPVDIVDPITPEQLGRRFVRSDDRRVNEGGFVGRIRSIAQRLAWCYKAFHASAELLEMPEGSSPHRVRRSAALCAA